MSTFSLCASAKNSDACSRAGAATSPVAHTARSRSVVRRVKLDLAVHEPRRVRLALHDQGVEARGNGVDHGYRLSIVDLRDSPDEPRSARASGAWLEENLPAGDHREWSRKLYDAGYAGLTWPEEYGGKGAPYSHQAIVLEEFARPGRRSTWA